MRRIASREAAMQPAHLFASPLCRCRTLSMAASNRNLKGQLALGLFKERRQWWISLLGARAQQQGVEGTSSEQQWVSARWFSNRHVRALVRHLARAVGRRRANA